jgi:hypothetical protein
LGVDMPILGYVTTSVTSAPNHIKFIFLLTSYLPVFHNFQVHKVKISHTFLASTQVSTQNSDQRDFKEEAVKMCSMISVPQLKHSAQGKGELMTA